MSRRHDEDRTCTFAASARLSSRVHFAVSAVTGQSIVEYVLVVMVVSAAVMAMQTYAKRGIQASVKVAADRLSPVPGDGSGEGAQLLGMRSDSGDRPSQRITTPGRVLARRSATRRDTQEEQVFKETPGVVIERTITRSVTTTTGTLAVPGKGSGISNYSEVVAE